MAFNVSLSSLLASGSNVSRAAVGQELHSLRFHVQMVMFEPQASMHNTEHTATGLWSSGNVLSAES